MVSKFLRRRPWPSTPVDRPLVVALGVVGLAMLVSGFLYYRGVVLDLRWRVEETAYSRLVEWLDSHGEGEAVVMLGDPPGYWYYGGGPSIVVPNEPVETVLAVANRYGARYLVLDANRPHPLAPIYKGTQTHPRLWLMDVLEGDVLVYRVGSP